MLVHGNKFYICIHATELTNSACYIFRTCSFVVISAYLTFWCRNYVPSVHCKWQSMEMAAHHFACYWPMTKWHSVVFASHCMLAKVIFCDQRVKRIGWDCSHVLELDVEWLAFLHCIIESPGLIFSPEARCRGIVNISTITAQHLYV